MKKNSFIAVAVKNFFKALIINLICFIGGGMITSASSSAVLRAVLQIVFFLALLVLFYGPLWEMGERDSNLVKIESKKSSLLKGLWCGLISGSPFILSGLLLILEKAGFVNIGVLPYYRILSGVFYPLNYSILPVDRTLSLLSYNNIILSVSMHLVLPIVCGFAYAIGRSTIKISDWVLYKKSEA